MTEDSRNPFELRALARGLDFIPYVAVVAVYPALVFRMLGEPPTVPPSASQIWWHEFNVNAILLYVPVMIVCAIVEWLARRHGWPRLRAASRTVRWLHFAAAFYPLVYFLVMFVGYDISVRLSR